MTASIPGAEARVDWRALVRLAVLILVFCALMFLAAGTFQWRAAWLFTVVYVVGTITSRYLVARRHPDLLAERAKFTAAEDVKPWDKVLAPLVALGGSLCILLVAGFDHRFGWSPAIPPWFEFIGLALLAVGFALGTWAMLENRFFSGVVRIQADRGHAVVDAGPYRYVRHPGYAGGIVGDLSIPLALGSLWAFVPALLTVALIVVRTALEDRTLIAELPGYAAYAARVRRRLLPGVW